MEPWKMLDGDRILDQHRLFEKLTVGIGNILRVSDGFRQKPIHSNRILNSSSNSTNMPGKVEYMIYPNRVLIKIALITT